jgi:hypothetical protein
VDPLGATTLLAPTAEGTWPGAGEPPAAPAASTVVLPATSSVAAAFTAASSVALSSATLFAAASSMALLSVTSLSAVVVSSSTAGPTPESYRCHFCRCSSSSDDTSSSSRMTRICLPLPKAGAALEVVATSTAHRGATEATCRTAAYQDASTACWQATTTVVTTNGAT